MDNDKAKENYNLIKEALKEHLDRSNDKLIELAKYINDMVINAIKKREYLPVGFDERQKDIKIVKSVNKSIIEDIIGMPLDKVVIAELADVIPDTLGNFYYNDILDDEYYSGFFFEMTMELVDDTTVNIVVYVKDRGIWD